MSGIGPRALNLLSGPFDTGRRVALRVLCEAVLSSGQDAAGWAAALLSCLDALEERSSTDTHSLWVPGPMPGLNEIIDACKTGRWGAMKRDVEKRIALYARAQHLAKLGPSHFTLEVVERTRQRDPDNLFAAMKVLLDSLRRLKLLDNDGWKHVLSIAFRWRHDPHRPGVKLITRSPE